MHTEKDELYEMLKRPNVKVIKGRDGKTWTCWDPDESLDLREQACEKTEDIQYDRGFGG